MTPSSQRHLNLTSDHWDLLFQLVVVFKPLQIATTALCKDLNISSSLIHPIVNGLIKCPLKADNEDLPAVKRFKEVVTTELQRCDPENVAVFATAVDPRYRQLKFFSTEQRKQMYSILQDKVETSYHLHE